jgi:hypothetical protein
METGYVKIEYGKVEIKLVNGTVWITKWELAQLFNVFEAKIEANLRNIFKNRLLWENDVTYIYRYTDKGIEKQIVYYNMDVLMFLSYRITSLEAQIFRKWINKTLQEHVDKVENKNIAPLVWTFKLNENYPLT